MTVLATLSALALLLAVSSPASRGSHEGKALGLIPYTPPVRAPEFVLSDLEGKPVALKDFRGRLVLLNLWTTWCPACREEMPSLERLHREFGGLGLTIVAASLRESADDVASFAREFGLTFPILLDTNGDVAERYGLQGLPTTFVIAPDGRLLARAIGPRDWSGDDARAFLRALLGTKEPGR